jgi:hypothetical protein
MGIGDVTTLRQGRKSEARRQGKSLSISIVLEDGGYIDPVKKEIDPVEQKEVLSRLGLTNVSTCSKVLRTNKKDVTRGISTT